MRIVLPYNVLGVLTVCLWLPPTVSWGQAIEQECTLIADGVIRVVPQDELESHELAQATCRERKIRKRPKAPSRQDSQRVSPKHARSHALDHSIVSKQVELGGSEKKLSPDQVTLEGAQKNFTFTTPVGRLQIRWQVKSTPFFGREPYFIVKEAWIDAARSLARRSFPVAIRSAKFDWKLVFLDAQATARTYPWGVGDCHPAWIRPPADIFVSAFYIGTGCGRGQLPEHEARQRLVGTLYHEFGHAVEYQLMGLERGSRERYHSEGFAMWFEAEALSDHGRSSEAAKLRAASKRHFREDWDPTTFDGSFEDYVRAFAMIDAIVAERDLRRLIKIYERLAEDSAGRMSFAQALAAEVGWDLATWKRLTQKHLRG